MVEHDVHGVPLGLKADASAKAAHYESLFNSIDALLEGETDWVAAMSTVACCLHHAFEYYHWTGFYCMRPIRPDGSSVQQSGWAPRSASQAGAEPVQELVIGPYQGHLGCLRIALSQGVCGAAASTRQTQLVPHVSEFPGHIACASSTQSEVVVPVLHPTSRQVVAVLDVDSDYPAAFDEVDAKCLEKLCDKLCGSHSRTSVMVSARAMQCVHVTGHPRTHGCWHQQGDTTFCFCASGQPFSVISLPESSAVAGDSMRFVVEQPLSVNSPSHGTARVTLSSARRPVSGGAESNI